ncbi:MAG TPA: hypothetical protein ENK05_11820 [Gammaproteobacteria bacterium]|nr:hypothetical protein [Gammaproteobacteria bacterium]
MLIETPKMIAAKALGGKYVDDIVGLLVAMHRGSDTVLEFDHNTASYTPTTFARNANGTLKIDDATTQTLSSNIHGTVGAYNAARISAMCVFKKGPGEIDLMLRLGPGGASSMQPGIVLKFTTPASILHAIRDDGGYAEYVPTSAVPYTPSAEEKTYIFGALWDGPAANKSGFVFDVDSGEFVIDTQEEASNGGLYYNVGFGNNIRCTNIQELYGSIMFVHNAPVSHSEWRDTMIAAGKALVARHV